jgi:hypothetical protein
MVARCRSLEPGRLASVTHLPDLARACAAAVDSKKKGKWRDPRFLDPEEESGFLTG